MRSFQLRRRHLHELVLKVAFDESLARRLDLIEFCGRVVRAQFLEFLVGRESVCQVCPEDGNVDVFRKALDQIERLESDVPPLKRSRASVAPCCKAHQVSSRPRNPFRYSRARIPGVAQFAGKGRDDPPAAPV